MKNLFVRFVREDEGQDIIEYALLASFVAFGALSGAQYLAGQYNLWFSGIGSVVADSVPSVAP